MKPRRVTVTLEVLSDEPIANLRNAEWWRTQHDMNLTTKTVEVVQAQANVIKPARRAKD